MIGLGLVMKPPSILTGGVKKIPLRFNTGGGKVLSTYSPRGAVPTDTTAITATIISRTEENVDLVAENNMRTPALGQMTGQASRPESANGEINPRSDPIRFVLRIDSSDAGETWRNLICYMIWVG